MSYVFISYAHKDQVYARKLADYLLENSFDVWIDDRIDFGANWEREIFIAIDGCGAIIIIMTPESYQSLWVQRERQHAENRGKQPFPLLLEGDVFPFYNIFQYYDVRGEKLPEQEFLEQLVTLIPKDGAQGKDVAIVPQQVQPHSRLYRKPNLPIVRLISPQPNAIYTKDKFVDIQAVISNAGLDIERVEFVLNSQTIISQNQPNHTGASAFLVTARWKAERIGVYYIDVGAYRSDDSRSAPVTVEIVVVPQFE